MLSASGSNKGIVPSAIPSNPPISQPFQMILVAKSGALQIDKCGKAVGAKNFAGRFLYVLG